MTLDGRHLAATAYHALADQLSKAQQELIMLDMVQDRFQDSAIATSSICRGSAGEALRKSREQIEFQRENLRERIVTLLQTLRDMEPVFAKERAADDAAFADFIRERMPKAAGAKAKR